MEVNALLMGACFIFNEFKSKLLSTSLMSGNKFIVTMPSATAEINVVLITGGWLLQAAPPIVTVTCVRGLSQVPFTMET